MVKPDRKINPLKITHPNSRKAKQFARQVKKIRNQESRLAKHSANLNDKKTLLFWFRNNSNQHVTDYTPLMFLQLIDKYINRNSEELKEIESSRKLPGIRKRHASREDSIKNNLENESRDFNTCGLEVPDLLDKEYLKRLRAWDGDIRTLEHFPLVRYAKSKLEVAA